MSSKRLHLILMGIIGLLFIGLVGGAYGINSLLSTKANELTSLKAKSQALGQEQIGLTKAKKDIQEYADLEKIAKAVVPNDKSQAEAVREITNIAAQNEVSLGAINFPASTLGTVPGGTGTAPTPPPASSGSSKNLSQLTPVKNIPGVYELQITVNGDANNPVRYSRFINFLDDLEHNRRTAQVTSIILQPDEEDRNYLTFTLTLNQYIKP